MISILDTMSERLRGREILQLNGDTRSGALHGPQGLGSRNALKLGDKSNKRRKGEKKMWMRTTP
jgi:hypothetical protein